MALGIGQTGSVVFPSPLGDKGDQTTWVIGKGGGKVCVRFPSPLGDKGDQTWKKFAEHPFLTGFLPLSGIRVIKL